jgi:hypothetical protein
MISIFYNIKPTKLAAFSDMPFLKYEYYYQISGFSTQDFIDAIRYIPSNILPEHRKKRQNITALLSANETEIENGFKIFKRIKRGQYLFNHKAIVKNEADSSNIYKTLDASVFYDIFERKINNPECEEEELQKYNRRINGDSILPAFDLSPISFKETQNAIEKKLSIDDVVFRHEIKRLGYKSYNEMIEVQKSINEKKEIMTTISEMFARDRNKN